MRYVGYVFAMMFTLSAWAVQFPGPDGTYTGTGSLTNLANGQQIQYTEDTILSSVNNTISTHFHYSTGFDYTLTYDLMDGQYGQFTMMLGTKNVGMGFCIGSTCQVELNYKDPNLGALHVNVSYAFNGNTIVATGHNFTSNTIFQTTSTLQ